MSFSDTINATTINASKFYKDGEVVNHSHIASGDITASEIKLSDGTNETLLIPFTSQDGNIYGLKINPLYDNENGVNIVNNTSRNKISVGIGTNNANGINLTIGDSNNDINKLPDNVYDTLRLNVLTNMSTSYHGLHWYNTNNSFEMSAIRSSVGYRYNECSLHFSVSQNENEPTEKMTIRGNGNVGIGVTEAVTKLQIKGDSLIINNGNSQPNGGNGGRIFFGGLDTYSQACISGIDYRLSASNSSIEGRYAGGLAFYFYKGPDNDNNAIADPLYPGASTTVNPGVGLVEAMRIDKNGYVGIGITEPGYPLEVSTGPTGNWVNNSGTAIAGFDFFPAPNLYGAGEIDPAPVSIKTYGWIWSAGAGFVATSDSRIKENIQDVPDDLSLQTLRDISCNYYEYKDKKSRGIQKTIGFIAQQVKEKMPMAVILQRDCIPNEMRILENPSWEELPDNKFKLTIPDLEDVSGNTKYKFYMSNDVSGNDEIMKESKTLENDTKSFIFDRSWKNVFLYGKEVNDFHVLDKQKLFALNFSATQEIDRIQQKHKIEIAELNNKVISLQNQLESVLKRLDNLESN